MEELVLPALKAWESFYVIIGTSAAALIGLMFVMITLVAEAPTRGTTSQGLAAFGTPNIVHLSTVLLLSAVISAPWHSLSHVALAIGAMGFAGICYSIVVMRRAHAQDTYTPVFEDWLWHAALPFLSYTLLLVAALLMHLHTSTALFSVAVTAMLLVFIAVHNAWDTVTYFVMLRREQSESPTEPAA